MSNTDSPLHIAVKNNNIEIAKLLLEGKCDVHAVNAEGLTPLQLATQMGNAEIITLLFQHGAGDQPKATPPPVTPKIDIASGGHSSINALPHDVKQRKKRITFWTVSCMIGYFLLMIAFFILSGQRLAFDSIVKNETALLQEMSPQEFEEIVVLARGDFNGAFVIASVIGLAYLCCFYMYLYRLWEEMPTEFASTTPRKAAGFSFIPIFNWYWWSVAFTGLYRDMNKTMESYGLETRFGTVWIRIACIFWFVMALLQFIVFGLIPNPTDGIIFMLVTIPTYWIVRNTVHRFIDIKSSQGH